MALEGGDLKRLEDTVDNPSSPMSNKALSNTRDVSMIEFRHLRYFLALAKHLHFAKAASSVNVTQPSLSRQIAALEEELECTLVVRNSRSVTLTAAGQELQRSAQKVIQSVDASIRTTQAVARGERGELRIAFTSMIAWTAFPRLVKRYSASFPNVALNMTELLPTDLSRSVDTGESDLCLAFKEEVDEPLVYRSLHFEKLVVALPDTHPLAKQKKFSLPQLKDEPFILCPRSIAPTLHDTVMTLCRDAGFDPEVRMHTHLQGTIVNLVAEGLGISFVPEAMARSAKQGVRFLPIPESPQLELGIIWNSDNQNPCLAAFLAVADDPFV